MRATISFSDLSIDRPSLLIRYLAAIGPGTVVCKTSSLDIRHDGTSLEMLRARLPHYAFLPIPNAHYHPDDAATIGQLIEAVDGGVAIDQRDTAALAFLDAHDMGLHHSLRDWRAQLDLGEYGTAAYAAGIERIYQLPETGPLIVVGAPEDFLGYPRDGARHAPAHPSPLHRLLLDSGYAARFQLFNAQRADVAPSLQDHRDDPDGSKRRTVPGDDRNRRRLADVGIIHLGRTPSGRTVLVVAGSSHPFGTLAGVRMLCDHGRNPLQHLVAGYADRQRDTVIATYTARSQIEWDSVLAFPPSLPIEAEIEVEGRAAIPSELAIRECEVRCAALDPQVSDTARDRSLLADHLRTRGVLSVVVKSYPNDRRDDATAKDLLQSILPGVRTVSVPENVPQHRGEDTTDAALAAGVALLWERKEMDDGSVIGQLARFKEEWWERIIHWRRVLDERVSRPQDFRQFVENVYRLPASGPLLVLGEPRSFLGADTPPGKHPPPQLAAHLDDAGHPNRFELRGWIDGVSSLYDHRAMRMIGMPRGKGHGPFDVDVGLIHLTRGVDDRDLLVIAGNNWLGTLAGVQLAFAERRPSVDRAVQDYIAGRRHSVDIGYRCRRVEARRLGETTRYPMCHPSVDLEVELIDEPGLDEAFRRSRRAAEAFEPLWRAVRTVGPPPPTHFGDRSIAMHLDPADGEPTLRITCAIDVRIRSAGDVAPQPMFACDATAKLVDRFRKAVRQELRTYRQDVKNHRHRCYCFLVVGPPGSGKEAMGHLLRQTVGPDTKLVQANVAGLSETLVQSQLFGHKRGAFTGANENRSGLVQQAGDGGVCVLDEFVAGPDSLQSLFQPQLLRFLQFGTGLAVGETATFHQRAFVLASTNETETLDGLSRLVREGRVRPDLRDRFAHRFELPPLGDRPLEILPTFLWMMHRARTEADGEPPAPLVLRFERRALELLLLHGFPGNFRELDQLAARIAFDLPDGDPLVTTAAMETALLLRSDDDARSDAVIRVELSWHDRSTTPRADPASPRASMPPAAVPRDAIAWPTGSAVVRGLVLVDDPAELCRRLVIIGDDDGVEHKIRTASAAMIEDSPGRAAAAAASVATGAADPDPALLGRLIGGLLRAGANEADKSPNFDVAYLFKWILFLLGDAGTSGQRRQCDPGRCARFAFPSGAASWQSVWRKLWSCDVSKSTEDGRLLRALVLLLLTGVDVRTAEELARIDRATAFTRLRQQSR